MLEAEAELKLEVELELSDWRPVNDCSACGNGLVAAVSSSCGLREFEAGENRVWARKERPVGWEGTVSSLSGRT